MTRRRGEGSGSSGDSSSYAGRQVRLGRLSSAMMPRTSMLLALLAIQQIDADAGSRWPALSPEPLGVFSKAAVATSSPICAAVGSDMLRQNGSAADAAVATLFCIGIVHPNHNGIGGGSFMNLYDKALNKPIIYDYREVAPAAATEDMYVADIDLSLIGGLAVAVPGEVAGLRKAWEKHGRLPWNALLQPSIDLCERGVTIDRLLANRLQDNADSIGRNRNLRSIFFDKCNKRVLKEGEKYYNRKLGATLRRIAIDPYSYYNGTLALDIVSDLRESGSIITAADLSGYKVKVREPLSVNLKNSSVRLFFPPPPSSGAIVGFILKILDGYGFTGSDLSPSNDSIPSTVQTLHRMVEAFKLAYAKRSYLGDPDFVDDSAVLANLTSPEFAEHIRNKITDNATHDTSYYEPAYYSLSDHGTSHVSVLDADGNAAAATSTINTEFGSMVAGSRTGIIFNNEMNDFSTPGQVNAYGYAPSATNFIRPGKRPLSSMSPSIALDAGGNVVVVVGATGGSRIITAISWAVLNHLYFGLNLKEAIDRPRLHHQLTPAIVYAETGFPQAYLDGLARLGHAIDNGPSVRNGVTNDIAVTKEAVTAFGDNRNGGGSSGY